MSYLLEVTTKAQDWRKRLASIHSEMEDLLSAPAASVREYVAPTLAALDETRLLTQKAGNSLAALEASARGAPNK